jgi:2-polyprenyl-6-hydroxyphenyl methylase / 3-demethylubiquinone-9 3-methyltransferase
VLLFRAEFDDTLCSRVEQRIFHFARDNPMNTPLPASTANQANVNTSEIAKFSQHATQWWDTSGPLKTLHQLNPARVGWIEDVARRNQSALVGQQLMDVGCGGGILSEALAKLGAEVTGLDMAADSIEVARAHALSEQLSIDYQATTVEAWAQLHPGRYSVLTCMELLEHVPDPASVIRAASTLLAPSGIAFFSTINRHPKAAALTIGVAEYVLRWIPVGTHSYDTFIKPSELAHMARSSGLEVIELAGVEYQPWASREHPFVVTRNTQVNYMMACRKR